VEVGFGMLADGDDNNRCLLGMNKVSLQESVGKYYL